MKKKYLNRPLHSTQQVFFGAGLCLLVTMPGLVQAQMSPAYTLPLNGRNQYAGVPNNATLEFATGTVEMWVKPNWVAGSLGGANPSFAAERTPSGNATRFSLHITDGLDAIGIWNNGAWQKIAYSFTQGQWYHVAAVMTTSNTQFYVNGSLVGTTSNGINTSITGINLTLGTSAPAATAEYFKGEIDEVLVWNTARSASQISANKSVAIGNPATAAGLVAY
ncbi:MAG: LamG domain-containing protein, partial [Hymenobacter sp.]